MLIPSSMRYIQKNIHVNIYVAVNLMIGGPDISGEINFSNFKCKS